MLDKSEGPSFSTEDLAENQRRRSDLIAACAAGECVLVTGAGLGMRLGYPDWSELLNKLYELALSLGVEHEQPFVRPVDFADNPLRYADCLRNHIRACTNSLGRYHSFLQQTFGDHGNDLLHRQLVELPFRGIVTANYDPSLDNALADKEPTRAVITIL